MIFIGHSWSNIRSHDVFHRNCCFSEVQKDWLKITNFHTTPVEPLGVFLLEFY